MHPGTLIEYRLQLFGVPFHWVTEIREWIPPSTFVDAQKKGPYRQWVHRHTFRDSPDGGTIIEDEVRYQLPLLPVGEAAFPMVSKELERIFAYRQEAIRDLLVPAEPSLLKKG
jgi:ligand-binding SRPBCC domain-containing protein